MKKMIFALVKIFLVTWLLFYSNLVSAQEFNASKIQFDKPKIINFKALAEYELYHPLSIRKKQFNEKADDIEEKIKFKPGQVKSNAIKFNAKIPQGENRSVSPLPIITFNGIIDDNYCIPPDVNGAVGDSFIMETTNQTYSIFNKTGKLISSLNNLIFFSDTTTTIFDTHIIYDVAHNRFVLVAETEFSPGDPDDFYIAVSETNDPTGNWHIYPFNGINNDYDIFDYPQIGLNEKWVVVTGDDYLASGGTQVNVYVFNRDNLYSGSAGSATTFNDPNSWAECPTLSYDTISSSVYLVQDVIGNYNGNGYIAIGTISGNVGSPVYSAGTQIGVNATWNDYGIGVPQRGSTQTITTGVDDRFRNAVLRNGSIWMSHTVFLPAASPTYAAADWWQVDTSLSLIQFGRIQDTSGQINYFYPSINVNAKGDAILGYCITSPNMYAGAAYSFRSSTDPLNTMESGYIFQNGLDSYYKTGSGGINRWGDFNGTAIDPVDSSFWIIAEFADTPANTWGTSIANVIVGAPSGINTIAETNSSIKIYPNPAASQINLIMSNLPSDVYTIALYDIFGQKILEKQTTVNSLYYTMPMDVSILSAGIYFICVVGSNQEWKQSIIKR